MELISKMAATMVGTREQPTKLTRQIGDVNFRLDYPVCFLA